MSWYESLSFSPTLQCKLKLSILLSIFKSLLWRINPFHYINYIIIVCQDSTFYHHQSILNPTASVVIPNTLPWDKIGILKLEPSPIPRSLCATFGQHECLMRCSCLPFRNFYHCRTLANRCCGHVHISNNNWMWWLFLTYFANARI